MNQSTLENKTGGKVTTNISVGESSTYAIVIPHKEFGELALCTTIKSKPRAMQALYDMWWRHRSNEVFLRDKWSCCNCGTKRDLHCDHVVERSRGGKDNLDNLQTLCAGCHSEKHRLVGRWKKS